MSIFIINGPNLNLLGARENSIYGDKSLEEMIFVCTKLSKQYDIELMSFQSNSEGEIINYIHKSIGKMKFCIANLGAYTHTSIAIRDAFLASKSVQDFQLLEVHISNVYKRESFRHKSLICDISSAVMTGFGHQTYRIATVYAIEHLLGKNII